MAVERNWAGNYRYAAERIHYPASVRETQEIIARSTRVKALGTRHSFNGIADSEGDLISLERLACEITVDVAKRAAGVTPNTTYGSLCPELNRRGFALPNLASLPHISVAGACATGTHGSGVRNRILASSVSAVEYITATGDLRSISREDSGDEFRAVVVGLGAFGIVTRVTLDLVPAFTISQVVYENVPMDAGFEQIAESGYSVSLFTDWRTDSFDQLWVKRRVGSEVAVPSALPWAPAETKLHPIRALAVDCCTEQLGVPGPWHERLPHFRLEFTPSVGEELQSEYFVPRESARAAFRAVAALKEVLAPALLISEVRTIDEDDFFLSPCQGRSSVAIHFTWKPLPEVVGSILPNLEEALAPFAARPHWGKLFSIPPPRIRALYPRFEDFARIRRTLDPRGKFMNPFLKRLLGAET